MNTKKQMLDLFKYLHENYHGEITGQIWYLFLTKEEDDFTIRDIYWNRRDNNEIGIFLNTTAYFTIEKINNYHYNLFTRIPGGTQFIDTRFLPLPDKNKILNICRKII